LEWKFTACSEEEGAASKKGKDREGKKKENFRYPSKEKDTPLDKEKKGALLLPPPNARKGELSSSSGLSKPDQMWPELEEEREA